MQNSYSSSPSFWQRARTGVSLLTLGLGVAVGAQAQTLNLPAAGAQSLAGTYADLGSAGAAIATPDFDDSNSAPQAIGFSFTFGGTSFTQFVLNTNGYVKLGSTAPPTPYFSTTPLTVAGGPLKGAGTFLLVPFNTDLESAASGGTEYRLATTGNPGNRVCTIQWKNVSDKTRAALNAPADKQLASFSFQLKLYEGTNNVEFVYGPAVASTVVTPGSYALSFAHVGLKGAGSGQAQVLSVTKTSSTPWSTPTFQTGTYPDYTAGFIFANTSTTGGSPASVLPDAGRTYRFNTPVANDLAVSTLYAATQVPTGQAYAYQAYLTNPGSTSVSGQTATLTLTGANPQTATVAVPSLAAGAGTTVRFPGLLLSTAGTTTATVTLPADGNLTNNTQAATTTVGTGTFSYIAGSPSIGSTSFPSFGSSTSAFAVKYTARTPYTLNVVRARLGGSFDNVGSTVYGVVADTLGNVLAQSAPYQIKASDLNTLHSFALTAPVQVPAGSFLAGLAQVIVGGQYPLPMALEAEVPTRTGTYFTFGITTPGSPTDITLASAPGYRYPIEAGFSTTLATAPPALAGTLSVYPNPSASRLFTLDVRGANAPTLTIEVSNALGQRVHAGTVRNDLATTLDLRGLATGIYYLQVRSGAAVTVKRLVIAQ